MDAKKVIDAYVKKRGKQPAVLFIENHGVFFSANSRGELDAAVADVMGKLSAKCKVQTELFNFQFSIFNSNAAAVIRTIYAKNEGWR